MPQAKLKIGGRDVVSNELTVKEVRAWMQESEQKLAAQQAGEQPAEPEQDGIATMLLEDMSFEDIVRLSNLTMDDLNDMLPSEVEQAAALCKKANRVFFQMWARIRPNLTPELIKAAQRVMAGKPDAAAVTEP